MAQTRPHYAVPSHLHPPGLQYLSPYGKYWRPGPGEGGHGVAWAEAGRRVMGEAGGGGSGGDTGDRGGRQEMDMRERGIGERW